MQPAFGPLSCDQLGFPVAFLDIHRHLNGAGIPGFGHEDCVDSVEKIVARPNLDLTQSLLGQVAETGIDIEFRKELHVDATARAARSEAQIMLRGRSTLSLQLGSLSW
ncbi:MAG: hypothetical protein GWN47_11240 [Woeseiaceae bacterium]|nr:hypothetical protein [Woeseiaceae bacterium]